MRSDFIPAGSAGTRATLNTMVEISREAAMPSRIVVAFPRDIDTFLRSVWLYVEDGQYELIRDPRRNVAYVGDCDDAAVWAGALLFAHRAIYPNRIRKASFVAVRPSNEAEFQHVFVLAEDDQGTFSIDPTAPVDADYQGWEPMMVPLF